MAYSTKDARKVIILDRTFPTIITLCGSTKFKEEFLQQQKKLSELGFLVLSVSFFNHADRIEVSSEDKISLDRVHKRKIDLSDGIFVINSGGYIGYSTRSEIEHASRLGLMIDYLEK